MKEYRSQRAGKHAGTTKTRLMDVALIISILLIIAAVITAAFLIIRAVTNRVTAPDSDKQQQGEKTGQNNTPDIPGDDEAPQDGDEGENETPNGVTNQTEYDYSSPVPESEPVNDTYFDNAVFIGNSRTEGLKLYTDLSADTLAYNGLMVTNVNKEKCIKRENGSKVTVIEALGEKQYEKVYIMLGLNELGFGTPSVFSERYGELIDKVRELQPDAQIYIQSILPVTSKKSQNDNVYNNQNVTKFNDMLKELVAEKQIYYLDVASGLADVDGTLPVEGAAADGIHLKKSFCDKWLTYLKNHTVQEAS